MEDAAAPCSHVFWTQRIAIVLFSYQASNWTRTSLKLVTWLPVWSLSELQLFIWVWICLFFWSDKSWSLTSWLTAASYWVCVIIVEVLASSPNACFLFGLPAAAPVASVCVCGTGGVPLMQQPKFYPSSSILLHRCDFCLSRWCLRTRGHWLMTYSPSQRIHVMRVGVCACVWWGVKWSYLEPRLTARY